MRRRPRGTTALARAVQADLAPMFGDVWHEVLVGRAWETGWVLWVRWRLPGSYYGCWFPIGAWAAHGRSRAFQLDYIAQFCWQHWQDELRRLRRAAA